MNTKQKKFFRTPFLVATTLLTASHAVAQQAAVADSTVASQPVQIPKILFDPVTYIWMLLLAIVVATVIALTRAIHVLTHELEKKTTGATEIKAGAKEYVPVHTAWDKLMQMLTRSVPVEKEADVMLDHNYDGIRELDNQLPPWWKWGFAVTIIFACVYIVNYHIAGSGKLQAAEYAEEMNAATLAKEARMKSAGGMLTAANAVRLTDDVSLGEGKNTFMTLCAACHGQQGQGMVGPNLTDDFWLHGGGIKNVFNTITEGVPAKGMISWKNQLSPTQIQKVASYVLSLHGTNPAGAKDPQGDKWTEPVSGAPADSAAVKADSLAVKKG